MTQSKIQTYTPEFRESAVKLALTSEHSIAHTARELGISNNTLYTWMNKYSHPTATKTVSRSDEHLYDELKRLKKENARLKEERDVLKKAALYFANDQR